MSLVFHCLQGRFGSEPGHFQLFSTCSDVFYCGFFEALCAHPEASPRTCDTGHQSAAQNPVNCLASARQEPTAVAGDPGSARTDGGQPEILGGSAVFLGAMQRKKDQNTAAFGVLAGGRGHPHLLHRATMAWRLGNMPEVFEFNLRWIGSGSYL